MPLLFFELYESGSDSLSRIVNDQGKCMFFEPACKMVGEYGYSFWPTQAPHWWMSLPAADQGAWAAGLGAFVAAFAALFISQRGQRRRNQTTHRKQRIVASYHFTPIAYLARDAAYLHGSLNKFTKLTMEQVSNDEIASFRQLIKESLAIIDRTRISEISQLPPEIAESIGFAVGGYTFVFGEIDSTLSAMEAQTRDFHGLKAELLTRVLTLDTPVTSTVKFIKWFQKEFGMQKNQEINDLLKGIDQSMQVTT